MTDHLQARIAAYRNSAEHNDGLYGDFARLTDTIPYLRDHRDFVERNEWGFGDRAFHYMWLLILADLAKRFGRVKALEIGVYKGQVISLWALIARRMALDVEITGVSPFRGNSRPGSRLRRRLRWLVDPAYRRDVRAGNIYPEDDYLAKVEEIFNRFDLDVSRCRLIRGLSSDEEVKARLRSERLSLVYIDGDHSFEAVREDIRSYAPLIEQGGYLVMDDASLFLPGNLPYKGREGVSRACEEIPSFGLSNVLNVGHDRVYRKDVARGPADGDADG